MPTITAKPITATPITARPLTAYRLGESADVSRWYLHWGGVNEYAVHSAWAMSGFGDRIEFSFVADDPGNQNQRVISGASVDGKHELFMLNATAVCYWVYRDTTGAYQAIVGPTAIAGTLYICTVSYNADGVIFTVNGTEYVNSAVPQLSAEFTNISSVVGGGGVLDGTIHYLRYVNATALQGANGVESNGVDITGTIPSITLTSATISFWLRYATGDQTILTGSVAILTVASDLFVAGANVTSMTVDGQTYGSETLVDGQDYFVEIEVNGGTLTTIGLMASGGIMGDVTVVSDGSTYSFDTAGDDGDDIPITIDGVASTPGTWQNYDSGVDQVALPKLSRYYKIADGPNATHLADSWGADAIGAELFNVAESDWDRSKT